MIYISASIFLFILLSFSNFLTLKFNFKNSQSYFISCCLIILFSFFCFFFDKHFKFNTIKYLIFFLFFFAFILLFFMPSFYKIFKNSNLDFLFFYFFIFFLSKDRYYLDQDEFAYWGLSLKELLFGLYPYDQFTHHPKGTSLFQYLLVVLSDKEGIAIFANNILLISGYFYLFYERKLLIVEKVVLFIIYYLLFNNLSFGFLSIYSDPVLAVFFGCLLKLIYFNFVEKKNINSFQFNISSIVIIASLLLINRASIIYLLIIICLIIFKIFLQKKKFFIILFFLFFLYIFYNSLDSILRGSFIKNQLLIESVIFLKYQIFTINFIELFTSPIYFSEFGALINGILNYLFLNNSFYQFKIPLFLYILFLGLILLFNLKNKFYLLFLTFFFIFIYSVIVFIIKFQIEKLHIFALQRYIAIFLLGIYLFYISIINMNYKNFKTYKSYILFFFLLGLIFVTPKKTIGFFAPENIYYSNESNRKFKINRDKVARIKDIKDVSSFFLIHKNQMSDYTNNHIDGEHSFYIEIILYELYPRKITAVEYYDFIDNIQIYKKLDEKKNFFIFYDLTAENFKQVSYFKNSYVINTY